MVVSCEDIVSTHWTHHQSKKKTALLRKMKIEMQWLPHSRTQHRWRKSFCHSSTPKHPGTHTYEMAKSKNTRPIHAFTQTAFVIHQFIAWEAYKKNNNKWLHLITIWSRQQPHLLRCTPTVMKKKTRKRERQREVETASNGEWAASS